MSSYICVHVWLMIWILSCAWGSEGGDCEIGWVALTTLTDFHFIPILYKTFRHPCPSPSPVSGGRLLEAMGIARCSKSAMPCDWDCPGRSPEARLRASPAVWSPLWYMKQHGSSMKQPQAVIESQDSLTFRWLRWFALRAALFRLQGVVAAYRCGRGPFGAQAFRCAELLCRVA